MASRNHSLWLDNARSSIARTVKQRRLAKHWSQAQLAGHLEISQNRLSELERDQGSFTAEQLLLLARLFNLPPSDFIAASATIGSDLQNALVRLGATDLHETLLLPSSQLEELNTVIAETLVDGKARLVTALAPVLVRHAERVHLARVQSGLAAAGFPRRLPWVIANIVAASTLVQRDLSEPARRRVVNAAHTFRFFLDPLASSLAVARLTADEPPDLLDSNVRTPASLEAILEGRSDLAKQWNIATSLDAEDFARSLRVALVA